MKPAKLNLTIYQGTTFVRNFTWSYKDSSNQTVYPDLTNSLIRMQIREYKESGKVYVEALSTSTTGSRFDIPDQTVTENRGKFVLLLSAEDTAKLNIDKGVYDIELQFPEDQELIVYRFVEGSITISKEVTR